MFSQSFGVYCAHLYLSCGNRKNMCKKTWTACRYQHIALRVSFK